MRWTFRLLAALALLAGTARADEPPIRPLIENDAYPWKAIGKLNVQGKGSCTGVLVAPDVVLSAAHCLYDWRGAGWAVAQSVHFVAGFRGQGYAFHARATGYLRPDDYDTSKAGLTSPDNVARDWAVIELEAAAGPEIGYLGVARLGRETPLPATLAFIAAGYGRDRPYALAGDLQCALLGWDPELPILRHDCRAVHGTSGAPILARRGGAFYVFAVVSATFLREDAPPVQAAVPGAAFFEAVRSATGRRPETLDGGLVVLPAKPPQ